MKKKLRLVIYILGLLFALQVALPGYINSSFIGQFVPEKIIGILYTISSIIAIICLTFAPRLLRKIGNYSMIFILSIISIISLLILAFSQSIYFILPVFIIYLTIHVIIALNFDILLEKQSSDSNTGNIRGLYLTISNLAWVVSPLIVGTLLTNGDYWKVYGLASLTIIPAIILLSYYFKDFKDPVYINTPFWKTLKKLFKLKNIYKIFAINTLLQFFYSWMVIYTPIYLHKYMGLDWKAIGFIFTIMLLPFLFFQLPLGILADKKFGEKEILNIAIIILGITTITLSFVTTNTVWVWATLLFITRIGASSVNIMSETYFFKKVDAKDSDIISFFRMAKPIAYILGPALASLTIFLIDFRYIFLVLGLIMLTGLKYSLTIEDTL
ncbi:MAG: MFS transporter [Candidatus Pacebacteria bacterium]|nr:MFS transporter [Candidatus Paceibacterota bacterium]